jgi:hypothetical protein
MGLALGQLAAGQSIQLDGKRGTDLNVSFQVMLAAGVTASCARPLAGAPYVFADGVSLEARARVTGTGEYVDVVAVILSRGTSTEPGVIQLFISESQIEKAFAAGAYGEITGDVNTVLSQRATEFLSFTADIRDSAVVGA